MINSSLTAAGYHSVEGNASVSQKNHANGTIRQQKGYMQSTDSTKSAKTDDWSPVLIKIAKDRDRAAFGKLFDHFAPKIKSYGMMLRSQHTSPQMAEELVQDVMLKVWLKAHCFDVSKASASTWIFTIARNCRTDFIRKANRTDTELSADDLWPMAEEEGPYTSLHQRRIEKNIHSAVAQLPPEQADVLKRIYIEGKSHSEVAAATGLPLGTVKSRVRLAVGKLRTLL
tara:strand:- start:217 stop:900 length:684 start_codon:yes stop_codon:yes gene_type:complete